MDYDNKLQVAIDREYKVFKANEIVQKARYDLNIVELKMLAFIFSKIKPTDTELQEYTFTVKEYCQVCGIDYTSGKNYDQIKKTIKQLRDKSFWLLREDGTETLIGWLSKARINKGSGKITVRLDDDMQNFVIGLFDNYTQYELLSTLPMKSKYSFRLYEILKSYAFTKAHTFNIDELKKMLYAETYINFKDFRKYVLEVAVKEINNYTDIEISWEPIAKGKKIIEVKIYIKQRDMWGKWGASKRAIDEIEGQLRLEDYYKG